MEIKTAEAEALAGGTSNLAAVFGIRPQSISGWAVLMPVSRAYELKVKKPEWFTKEGTLRKSLPETA